jgi:NAD(P)H dehydrogenase (quinone)
MPTLVVVCHPRSDSLTRAAAARVLAGLAHRGEEARVIDLEGEDFDPRLTLAEKLAYEDGPASRPTELDHHFDALRWADRIVFVYPTWFSGHPARLKGWFDRVWIPGVAFDLPAKGDRLRRRLYNIRRLEVVTTHGSPRWVNVVQAHSGQRVIFRSIRATCHPLCRIRRTSIYRLDDLEEGQIAAWLDEVERRYRR